MRNDYSYTTVKDGTTVTARSIKKRTGSYYTPEHLASLIAQDSIFKWLSAQVGSRVRRIGDLNKLTANEQDKLLNDIRQVTILDPAVGEGAFLLAAADWLTQIRVVLGDTGTEESRRQEILANCLFGVDLAENAIPICGRQIKDWASKDGKSKIESNIRHGNSLVGFIESPSGEETSSLADLHDLLYSSLDIQDSGIHDQTKPFHWGFEFPEVFHQDTPGFDIIVGNPPYGSILGQIERQFISSMYPTNVGGGRTGTWNSAAHFLVRATSLMKRDAQLGFLVPNSLLRVKQFSKTRKFLLDHTKLWKIVDEGSPFDSVTLEMVSIFCEHNEADEETDIDVESRRFGLEQSNVLSSRILRDSGLFPIYHDHILTKIHKKGQKGLLVAGRGRDIPKEHVRKELTSKFKIPYITSGRSVRRYSLRKQHIYYTDDWFLQNPALRDSFENEYLVATKNYRYPRCILKPCGMIHGGGIVKITPLYENADLRVLGLILNSKLVEQISIRYLTNYSQLTCCLNTGIMEELPLVLPEQPRVYRGLFDTLSLLHTNNEENFNMEQVSALEKLADALVYSLYFGDSNLEERVSEGGGDIVSIARNPDVIKMIEEIFDDSQVKELERLGSFPASRKLRRY